MTLASAKARLTDRPTWSEKSGRSDIVVHGFSLIDNLAAFAAGIIVLVAAILVIAGLST